MRVTAGLDLSKLDPLKRQLLGIEEPVQDDVAIEEEPKPLKTEEEIERELAEAEASLKTQDSDASLQSNDRKSDTPAEPPQKKQKRSRADMLRDLQAKIAASASGVTEVKAVEPTSAQAGKKSRPTAQPEPPAVKGFRPIERAPERKKRKTVDDTPKVASDDATNLPKPGNQAGEGTNGAQFDDDEDIFGGAGDYDDGLSADEESAEEGEERPSKKPKEDEDSGPVKYFDDQDEIIPKFETWRSPTPPPRQRTRSPSARDRSNDSDEGESQKPQRLEGFSTSQYSARELLEMDSALAKEEKRKLKKLKGKEKKEAMARLAELEGGKPAEQKEKDRLHREAQEYENYEKKKQKRAQPEP